MSGLFIPPPPAYTFGAGLAYASLLAKEMQRLAFQFLVAGWALVVVALLLAVNAAVVGSGEGGSGSSWFPLGQHPGLFCALLGLISAALGIELLRRSAAAARGASIASTAILRSSVPEVEFVDDEFDLEESAEGGDDEAEEPEGQEEGDEIEGAGDLIAYAACVRAQTAWLERRLSEERCQRIQRSLGVLSTD